MRKTILALALLSAACGDDSSDDGKQETDAGHTADSGTTGDAGSAALAAAQVTAGVNATEARKNTLVAAVCQLAVSCAMDTASACQKVYNDEWDNLVANKASDACRDAELDRVACLSGLDCKATGETCAKFDAPAASLCDSDGGT